VGPRGQDPSKNRQGSGKNNWTDHVPSELTDENFGILGHFWFLKKSKKKQMATHQCVSSFVIRFQ